MWNRYPSATGVSWSTLAAASSDPASPAGGECEAQQCAIAGVDHFLGPAGRNQGGKYIERHCFLGWKPPLLWNWWAMEIVDTPWVPKSLLDPGIHQRLVDRRIHGAGMVEDELDLRIHRYRIV
jgi:hypothetical protein